MRIFIGFAFDNQVKDYLQEAQLFLKTTSIKGNFTQYNNFHLTLKYLGEITHHELEEVIDIVEKIGRKNKPFSIKIGDLGSFNIRGKQLFWIDILEGLKPLKRLFIDLEDDLEIQGFERDKKKFNPHITIAREVTLNNDLNTIAYFPIYKNYIRLSKLTVFESHRINGVLTYTPVFEYELGVEN